VPAAAASAAGDGREDPALARSATIIIDGVHVDPQTLSCLDASGAPLAITRMGVKELRAELAARRAPVAGNKKELAKRLQVGALGCSS
jgi:hypothetical protein